MQEETECQVWLQQVRSLEGKANTRLVSGKWLVRAELPAKGVTKTGSVSVVSMDTGPRAPSDLGLLGSTYIARGGLSITPNL